MQPMEPREHGVEGLGHVGAALRQDASHAYHTRRVVHTSGGLVLVLVDKVRLGVHRRVEVVREVDEAAAHLDLGHGWAAATVFYTPRQAVQHRQHIEGRAVRRSARRECHGHVDGWHFGAKVVLVRSAARGRRAAGAPKARHSDEIYTQHSGHCCKRPVME